jgi:plasmid stability protein
MGSLTIRKLDDDIKAKLRVSASAKGISMEEEARRRLKESLNVNFNPAKPKLTVESILEFSVKSDISFNLKRMRDEMWEEVIDSHRP